MDLARAPRRAARKKIDFIKNLLDFSRSRDQRLPGSLLPKRKDPGYEVGSE
jgi:hypothetical protein